MGEAGKEEEGREFVKVGLEGVEMAEGKPG